MSIEELIKKIESINEANILPKYIDSDDISDSQVKINGEWKNSIYSWGILNRDSEYIYFETDDERGYLSFVKKFESESGACEYVYNSMLSKYNARKKSSTLDMAVRYIEKTYEYSEKRAKMMAEQIYKHDEIFEEFFNYMRIGKMRKKDRSQVEVCGYTAERLYNEYDLSPLGVYNYLVYLKEEPQRALEDLKQGLPKR